MRRTPVAKRSPDSVAESRNKSAAASTPARSPPLPSAAPPPPAASPRDISLKRICHLVDEVEAALEADKKARAVLQQQCQLLRSGMSTSSVNQSHDSDLADTPRSLHFPLSESRHGDQLSIISSTMHGSPAQLRFPTDPQTPSPVQALNTSSTEYPHRFGSLGLEIPANSAGVVWSKTAMSEFSRLKDVDSKLAQEQALVKELRSALAATNERALKDKKALEGKVATLEQQLVAVTEQLRSRQLEHEVFSTHKESLVNALKHERSLVNYAIAHLEKHGIDAGLLKQLQQQFAVDTSGGTYINPTYSLPPSLAGLSPDLRISPDTQRIGDTGERPTLRPSRQHPVELEDWDQ